MKLTFEGDTLQDIFNQMVLTLPQQPVEPTKIKTSASTVKPVDIPVDKPVDKPVNTAVEKPTPTRADKQAAAAKMRAAKQAKQAERAAAAATAEAAPVEMVQDMPMPPPPKTAAGIDPAELVRIRDQTLADLRAAHSGGFHREVAELLARFGNGAKSFRELQVEAFVPIREAIDNGALT